MVTVRVPATTANLGPGFDTFGCALALYDTLTFQEQPEGLTFTGVEPAYQNPENLAVVSYQAVMHHLGLPMPGLHLSIKTGIPICRGLGSSAALIVAGAAAANAAHGSPLSREELLGICNDIEGHPDNLAPAIFGGLVVSFVEQGRPVIARYSLHPSIRFTALIPDYQLSTHKAREALPKQVPFADAVFNVSHAAVLLKALEEGDARRISLTLHDRLHQPYRRVLIPGFDEAEELSRRCGCVAFCISGAGPTLLCLSTDPAAEKALSRGVSALPGHWECLHMAVDHEGMVVTQK